MNKTIGVLSLQGTWPEHIQSLNSMNCQVIKVQKREDLKGIHGLMILGTGDIASNLLEEGLGDRIKELAARDLPIFGMGSGMVLLSKGTNSRGNYRLGLMDLTVSGEPMVGRIKAYLSIPALGLTPVKAVFLNALYIQEIAPNVGILAEYNGKIVFVRQGNMLASAFYPEQTGHERIHRYFLDIVNGQI